METDLRRRLEKAIRSVPDFPKPGILFRDITPLLRRPGLLEEAAAELWRPFAGAGIDAIAGIESRGFVFAAILAVSEKRPLVLVRKEGKLPAEVHRETYELEYGRGVLEMHRDAVSPGQRILVVDDLLATGGTAAATGRLVRRAGGAVGGYAFLIELVDLGGRGRLEGERVHALVPYRGA